MEKEKSPTGKDKARKIIGYFFVLVSSGYFIYSGGLFLTGFQSMRSQEGQSILDASIALVLSSAALIFSLNLLKHVEGDGGENE